jgi:hypothetical protein
MRTVLQHYTGNTATLTTRKDIASDDKTPAANIVFMKKGADGSN